MSTQGNGKLQVPEKINKRVAQYVAVREEKRQLEAKYKELAARINNILNKLECEMLAFLDQTGQERARTNEGTVYVRTDYSASLADPHAFMEFVIEYEAFELMDRRANKTACREYCEEHGRLPPGVNLNQTRTVGVRKS